MAVRWENNLEILNGSFKERVISAAILKKKETGNTYIFINKYINKFTGHHPAKVHIPRVDNWPS